MSIPPEFQAVFRAALAESESAKPDLFLSMAETERTALLKSVFERFERVGPFRAGYTAEIACREVIADYLKERAAELAFARYCEFTRAHTGKEPVVTRKKFTFQEGASPSAYQRFLRIEGLKYPIGSVVEGCGKENQGERRTVKGYTRDARLLFDGVDGAASPATWKPVKG